MDRTDYRAGAIEALTARVDALQAAYERLAAEQAQLHASGGGGAQLETATAGAIPGEGVSRRRLLRTAVGVAAAAGAATVALERPDLASANTGDNVIAGEATLANSGTQLKWNGSSGFTGVLLLGNDTGFVDSGSLYPAAAGGWAGGGAAGVPNGVYGFTQDTNGNGVVGVNNAGSANGCGVLGTAKSAAAVAVKGDGGSGRGVVASGDTAQVQLIPGSGATHPASGAAGDIYVDSTARAWFCQGGTSWIQLTLAGTPDQDAPDQDTSQGQVTPDQDATQGQTDFSADISNPTVSMSNSGSGNALQASATTGAGGSFQTKSGTGIECAGGTGRGATFAGKSAALRLIPSSSARPPRTGKVGDLFVDSSHRLWFCKKGGLRARWKQIA
jgi:hypothetical protein